VYIYCKLGLSIEVSRSQNVTVVMELVFRSDQSLEIILSASLLLMSIRSSIVLGSQVFIIPTAVTAAAFLVSPVEPLGFRIYFAPPSPAVSLRL
jgi:hypothetical protein